MIDHQDSANARLAPPLGPASAALSQQPHALPQPHEDAATADSVVSSGGRGRRTTEHDEAIVSRIEDSLYQDYSRLTPEDVAADLASSSSSHGGHGGHAAARRAAESYFLMPPAIAGVGVGAGASVVAPPLIFPAKLHEMLSDAEAQGLVAWLPHGRAWKILDPAAFARSALLSRHFRHGNLRSFMRLVSGWGFRRVERGRDSGAYYHQLFLRGMTHLCALMSRTAIRTRRGERRSIYSQLRGVTPDFYRISEQFPLPPAPAPAARRSLRDAVPYGTASSSSSAVVAEAAGSSQRIVADAANSSSQSLEEDSTAGSAAYGRSGSTASSYSSSWSLSGNSLATATSGNGPRPDPAGSTSSSSGAGVPAPNLTWPDSPTSVMSRSPVLAAPHEQALLNLTAPIMGGGGDGGGGNGNGGGGGRSPSVRSALATAALQRYIARNAIGSYPPPGGGGGPLGSSSSSGSLDSTGSGASGVALAGRSEVFLRRLRERADLIESLRSIMSNR